VHNDDDRARIHLVADTVGGRGFWQHMRQARPHDRTIPGWQPRAVAPGNGRPELEFESFNLPLVMSPWEVREHIGFLLSETQPTEALRSFSQTVVGPFVREWHALWARYGDSGDGLNEFRALRDGLRAQLARFESLRLANGIPLTKALVAIVVANLVASDSTADVEARDQPRPATATAPSPRPGIAMPVAATPARAVGAPATVRFERPVILLSAPRSGSTLLFETLAKAPGLVTIGGESHRTIESLPGLHPSARGHESNRLLAADASAEIIAAVQRNFAQSLRDRDGRSPLPGASVRLLEKTPKNTLRLPFLRQVFPDARFVYLYREPREVLASMVEAWQSGRFRTYAELPGWNGLPWSLLLVPGWRELSGRPLEEVVAHQWMTTTNILLDDLQALPAAHVVPLRYADLVAAPQAQVARLCERLDIPWDRALEQLPLSRHTLTPPDPDKWRKHEVALARVLPSVAATQERAERFVREAGAGL